MKPASYQEGDVLDIHVGQLFSSQNSVPFDFYALNWCESSSGREYDPEAVGLSLGDAEITESAMEVSLLHSLS